MTLGEHFSSREPQDTTLELSGPVEYLSQWRFDNIASRYKIDGNEVWEFYGKPNFEVLLFTATGPVGWTSLDSDRGRYNDKISSVKSK